jgi:hypothetical protein
MGGEGGEPVKLKTYELERNFVKLRHRMRQQVSYELERNFVKLRHRMRQQVNL